MRSMQVTFNNYKMAKQHAHQACLVKDCEYNWHHDHKLCKKCKMFLDHVKDEFKDYVIRQSKKKI